MGGVGELRDCESSQVKTKLEGIRRGFGCFEDAFAISAAQNFVRQAGAGADAPWAGAAPDYTLQRDALKHQPGRMRGDLYMP